MADQHGGRGMSNLEERHPGGRPGICDGKPVRVTVRLDPELVRLVDRAMLERHEFHSRADVLRAGLNMVLNIYGYR